MFMGVPGVIEMEIKFLILLMRGGMDGARQLNKPK